MSKSSENGTIKRKRVHVVAQRFDCLPGHVVCEADGSGSNLRIALGRAAENIVYCPQIRGRRVHSFVMSVTISDEEVSK